VSLIGSAIRAGALGTFRCDLAPRSLFFSAGSQIHQSVGSIGGQFSGPLIADLLWSEKRRGLAVALAASRQLPVGPRIWAPLDTAVLLP